MQIAAITTFKAGDVYRLLKKHRRSVKHLAQSVGVCYSKMIRIVNLQWKPDEELAIKIQNYFGELGEFLNIEEQWPEQFDPLHVNTATEYRDIDPNLLPAPRQVRYLTEYSSGDSENSEDREILKAKVVKAAKDIWPGGLLAVKLRLHGLGYYEIACRFHDKKLVDRHRRYFTYRIIRIVKRYTKQLLHCAGIKIPPKPNDVSVILEALDEFDLTSLKRKW